MGELLRTPAAALALRFVDVPCGAGGLSLGYEEAGGFEQVLGIDKDARRARTYRRNGLGQVAVARIQDVDRLPPHEVYLGGIPCQPYSQLRWLVIHRLKGKLPEKWLDTTITGEVERLIERNRPLAFMTENVRRAPVPAPAGYHITPLLVDARWLGMQQPRVRRLTFGFRADAVAGPMPPPFYPYAGTDSDVRHIVLADRRAVPVKLLAGGKPKTVIGGPGTRARSQDAARLEGRRLRALTVTANPINKDPERKGRSPRKMVVGTVFAGHGPLDRSYVQHGRDEEWSRHLQGFPEWFMFEGNQDQRLSQIADAVPVPMAKWAAGVLRDWLTEARL